MRRLDGSRRMPTTKVLLIRHGETDDNRALVFQGQQGRGLNARGRDQAARLAARLVQIAAPIASLYASDLERAKETAEILGRALGLVPALDPALREVDIGAWTGLSYADVQAHFPEEWAAWQRGEDLHRGGGESYAELGARMLGAIGRLADAHPGEVVAAVSHGAAIKTLVSRVLGQGTAGLRTFRVAGNTGISVIERGADGAYRLLLWNDVAHLHDAVAEVLGA
jgi:probable phosphoglycerate mutase